MISTGTSLFFTEYHIPSNILNFYLNDPPCLISMVVCHADRKSKIAWAGGHRPNGKLVTLLLQRDRCVTFANICLTCGVSWDPITSCLSPMAQIHKLVTSLHKLMGRLHSDISTDTFSEV